MHFFNIGFKFSYEHADTFKYSAATRLMLVKIK